MITTSTTEFAEKSATATEPADASATLNRLLADCGFAVVGSQTLPGRPGLFAPVPEGLHERVRARLQDGYSHGLYSHQALAIQQSLDGHDICLSTPTASGKSLVFMATAAHELLSDDFARVLVLYPAKALIQDQLAKWQAAFAGQDMSQLEQDEEREPGREAGPRRRRRRGGRGKRGHAAQHPKPQ